MKRKELERLCRYITRPEIANERLKRNQAGQVVLQLKSPTAMAPPYRDVAARISHAFLSRRDRTPSLRRLGQPRVLAREVPERSICTGAPTHAESLRLPLG